MNVIVNLSIFPMDKPGQSLSPFVARVLDVIRDSGLRHELGPMGTCIEGEWAEVMAVVDACYRELESDSNRIYVSLNADCRKGRDNGMDAKVRSVQDKLR
ncbi:MAG: MTH1187 family thiamine-binding protein [Desulfovibrionaceae bacterium]|nr:MTH1187 family thiamine-binding protein [Desulfovibrionaceae bacterium]